MKNKNNTLPLKNRLTMLGLCVIFLAHLFLFHTHLLDFSPSTQLIDNACTNTCCTPNNPETQDLPTPCNSCCDCDLDIKTSDDSPQLSTFIPVEPFLIPCVTFYFFEENPPPSTANYSLIYNLVLDPLLGLRRALACTIIRC